MDRETVARRLAESSARRRAGRDLSLVRREVDQIQRRVGAEEMGVLEQERMPWIPLMICADYRVTCDGTGTHDSLAEATADAIATNEDKTIELCCSINESDIEIGGMDQNALITIIAHSPYTCVITANGGEDIFKQSSDGGYTTGGLRFFNVGFLIDHDQAIYYNADSGTGMLEMRHLIFESCVIGETVGGGYFARSGVGPSVGAFGNTRIEVRDTLGIADGFYYCDSTPPDALLAWNNTLALAHWWEDSTAADTSYVAGGFYTITNAMPITLSGQNDGWTFRDLTIATGCTGAAFSTSNTLQSVKGVHFENITLHATDTDTDFGDFQSPGVNNQHNLFICNIHGVTTIAAIGTQTGTFLAIDANILNPYVANIWAPDWATVYDGPTMVPPVPIAGSSVTAQQAHALAVR